MQSQQGQGPTEGQRGGLVAGEEEGLVLVHEVPRSQLPLSPVSILGLEELSEEVTLLPRLRITLFPSGTDDVMEKLIDVLPQPPRLVGLLGAQDLAESDADEAAGPEQHLRLLEHSLPLLFADDEAGLGDDLHRVLSNSFLHEYFASARRHLDLVAPLLQ